MLVLVTACQAIQPTMPSAAAKPTQVYFPQDQLTTPTPGRPFEQARLEGQVVVINGCLGLIAANSQPYIIVWPPEYTLRADGDQWQIRERATDALLATTGDIIALSGGYHPVVRAQWLAHDTLPAVCVEPFQDSDAFFIAGPWLEVIRSAQPGKPTAVTDALARRELQQWSSTSPDGAWVAEGLTAFPKVNDDNLYYTELRVKKGGGSVEWIPVALWSRFGLGYTMPRPLRWSPAGRYLYFTNAPVPDGCGLFVNAADLQRLDLVDGTIQEVLPFGATWSLAIAPDAQRAVYSNGDTLYLLDLATANYASIKVEGLEADAQWGNFIWSPDSQRVAFTIAYQPCMPPAWSHSLLLLDTDTLTVTTVLAKDPRRLTITEWVDAGNLALSDYDNKQWVLDLATGTIK